MTICLPLLSTNYKHAVEGGGDLKDDILLKREVLGRVFVCRSYPKTTMTRKGAHHMSYQLCKVTDNQSFIMLSDF